MDCFPCQTSDVECRQKYPEIKREFKEQLKIALPTALTQLSQYLLLVISVGFCGHLGNEILGGAALAITLINVTGNSVLLGIATACDTLFPQTFGSMNKFRVGIILQRSLLLMLLCCLPCCAILINTEHILLLLGENQMVSRFGGIYGQVYVGGLPGYAVSVLMCKYLQCQSIVIPSLIIYVAGNIFSASLHVLFLYVLKLEVIGAAISVSVSQWIIAFLHIGYIHLSNVYKVTWAGWSRDSLYDWCMIVRLAVPGLFMFCLDWWAFEIIVFIVGLLGVQSLASHTIVYNIFILILMGPIGLAAAAAVRIGNHLGENSPSSAKIAAQVAVCLGVVLSVISSIITLLCRNVIPCLFTSDPAIVSLASSLMIHLSVIVFIDCIQICAAGVLRGVGQQKVGAIVNFVAHYVFNLPLTTLLVLETSVEVTGAYWGILLGCTIQTVCYLIKVSCLDWEIECQKAQSVAGVTVSSSCSFEKNASEDDSSELYRVRQLQQDYNSLDRLQDKGAKPKTALSHVVKVRTGLLLISLAMFSLGLVTRLVLDVHTRHEYGGKISASQAFNETLQTI